MTHKLVETWIWRAKDTVDDVQHCLPHNVLCYLSHHKAAWNPGQWEAEIIRNLRLKVDQSQALAEHSIHDSLAWPGSDLKSFFSFQSIPSCDSSSSRQETFFGSACCSFFVNQDFTLSSHQPPPPHQATNLFVIRLLLFTHFAPVDRTQSDQIRDEARSSKAAERDHKHLGSNKI